MRAIAWVFAAVVLAGPFVARADIPPGPTRGCRCGSAELSVVALPGLLALVRRRR